MEKDTSVNSAQDPPRPPSRQPLPAHAQQVFKGVIFDVYQWEQKMFDGTTEIFEKLKRSDSINIIPVTIDKKILLTYEEQPSKRPFLSVPGGGIDAGEGVLAAAARELREETGHVAGSLTLWDATQPSSRIEWVVYTYIAKGCKRVGELELDPGEKIEIRPVSFDEFIERVLNGELHELATMSQKILQATLKPGGIEEFKKLLLW